MEFLRVDNTDIEKLSDRQLTELLSMLLYFEAEKWEISSNSVGVALNITVPDGGEDGRIKWEGGIDKTNWLPYRFTLFQCKATDMPPSKCEDEILSGDRKLKPMVGEVIENDGAYILFHNRTLNEQQQKARIESFRKAIDDSSFDGDSGSVSIHIYDAGKIAAWTNESISSVVAVWKWVGKHLPNGAKTWKTWSGYQENNYSYVLDDSNESNISQIRSHFTGVRKIARVIGLSGLGKTRLAFEAFRPPEDSSDVEQLSRSNQAIYLDAAVNSVGLPAIIATWRTQGLRGTVIIDNCNPEMHNMLKEEIEHSESQLNLLTLDFNPERYNSDHPYIELKQVSDEIIKGIISQGYPGISPEDVERIVDFAQGFPKIAVLLARARLNKDDDIGSLRDDVLIDKLLWGRNGRDPMKHKVISACALFEYIGFDGEVTSQRQFVTENICKITDEEFYGACQYFIDRGILDVRGRFIRVTPQPLAIRLATDWWKNCPPERAYQIVTADMPNGMSEALCDQMAKLHFLPKAQEITSSLCGEQAPFGQAEVLNSEKGSRLFRSLVEVNPVATARALNSVFGSMNNEELLQVGPGRRNLIWALEKLCFWEETFESASKILLLFAAAENESWGNNATSQFLQLFHYVLSGTQAHPDARLRIIDYSLESESPEVRLLGVKALGHALQTHHFTRMVGVEKQGSRPVQQEWRPKTWDEVFTYWQNALNRLTRIVIESEEMSEKACGFIANNIRGLVSYGRVEEVENSLRTIIDKKGPFWPSALGSITDTIKFDGPKIPKEGLERLQKWTNWLQPDDFIDQFKLIVSIPKWDHEKGDNGHYIDIAAEKAKEFALHTVQNHYNELLDNLQLILVGEQRKGYIFGHEIGRLVKESEPLLSRIISSLNEMVNTRTKNVNLSFVAGVLAAIQSKDSELVSNVLDEMSQCSNLSQFTVELTRFITISKQDLVRIVGLLREGTINVNTLHAFSYGSVLDHLTSDDVMNFISEIINYGDEGFPVGWHILYMYVYGDDEKFQALASTFKDMILSPGILINGRIDSYEIGDVTKKFIHYNEDQKEMFITSFTCEIVTSLGVRLNLDQIQNLRGFIGILMEFGWQYSWPVLSEALLSDDKTVVYNSIEILEPSMMDESTWLLKSVPYEVLEKWCEENETGPELLSAVVPVFGHGNEEGVKINPIANYLVTEHGDNDIVLSNISRSLGTFGWSGSIIPYYQEQIAIYKSFEKHRLSKVREWAQIRIEGLINDIEREKQREEENELGF
ncbi:hypothetical protein [Peribacillus simplex]|uniref:hypothetical protein n=1 Tax=Peribacillus simplex TaxID=1478 RepID=UPI003D00F052